MIDITVNQPNPTGVFIYRQVPGIDVIWGDLVKHPRLTSMYVSALPDQLKDSIDGRETTPVSLVDALAPDAKERMQEGALCIIPAEGGCFLVTGEKRGMVGFLRRKVRLLWPAGRARLAGGAKPA